MQLHSDFRDYYDSAIGLGIDPTVHFNRETKTLELDFRSEYRVPNAVASDSHSCSFRYVGFCGKVFPLVVICPRLGVERLGEPEFYYELDKILLKELDLGRWGEKAIRQFYLESPGDSDRFFREQGVPIWSVYRKEWGMVLELNPRLSPIEFFRVRDPFSAFQDISMYLTNVLIEQKEILTIEDKFRIEQHGFDPKLSFRKEKKKS